MMEPVSSSREALLVRAASAKRTISAAQAHRSSVSAWRMTGTISPPSVCVAMPMRTAGEAMGLSPGARTRAAGALATGAALRWPHCSAEIMGLLPSFPTNAVMAEELSVQLGCSSTGVRTVFERCGENVTQFIVSEWLH